MPQTIFENALMNLQDLTILNGTVGSFRLTCPSASEQDPGVRVSSEQSPTDGASGVRHKETPHTPDRI